MNGILELYAFFLVSPLLACLAVAITAAIMAMKS
jgi:hypothetical protein